MLGQLNIFGKTKLETTLERIKTFEPDDGYYLAFSGGKDSQCIYHLCKMAGVKFDAHYRVTSVDPPELVQFIKKQYPDVSREIPRDKDGKAVTMWNLIPKKKYPPTRIARYCCESLKESAGDGRLAMTGVRWAESANRRNNQGYITILKDSVNDKLLTDRNFRKTNRGGVVLVNDNEETRKMIDSCYAKQKTVINPIIDWGDDDVWEFLNEVACVPHCKLYDEGKKRLGCIGCPLQGGKGMKRDFERYPKYKKLYLNAFKKMLKSGPDYKAWKSEQDVYEWWVSF